MLRKKKRKDGPGRAVQHHLRQSTADAANMPNLKLITVSKGKSNPNLNILDILI